MHIRSMSESEGTMNPWKPTLPEAQTFTCRRCKSSDVWYREWESHDGGYEDTQYHCRSCNRRWWVEGDDA